MNTHQVPNEIKHGQENRTAGWKLYKERYTYIIKNNLAFPDVSYSK